MRRAASWITATLICGSAGAALLSRDAGSETPLSSTVQASECAAPVYLVVQGRITDRSLMGAYAAKLRDSGIYARYDGRYVATGRPIDIFEGVYPDDQTLIVAHFPCLARARQFWYSELYQREIMPLRRGAGRFTVAIYPELARED